MDKNELVVKCDPTGYAIKKEILMHSAHTIEDIQLEVRKNSGGMEARVLSSKHRYGIWLADGPYVPVRRDGDMVKIFDAVMNTCHSDIRYDHCPWTAKFVLKQVAANVLEGTIEVRGITEKDVNYFPLTLETVMLACDGKIILRREDKVK